MKEKGVHRISAVYGATMFFVKAVNFLLLPLFTHYITTAEFGVYSLVLSGYTLLSAVLLGGLQSAFNTFYIPEGTDERKRVFGFFLFAALLLTVPAAALTWIFAEPVSTAISGYVKYAGLVRVTALLLVFESVSTLFQLLFKANEQIRRVIFFSAITAAISVSSTLYFVMFASAGITGIAAGQLSGTVAAAAGMLFLLRENSLMPSFKKMARPIFLFSAPFVLGGLFSTITDFGDRFLLNFFLTQGDVGVYSFVYRIAIVVNIYFLAFRSAWIPRALREAAADNYSGEFGKVFTKLMGISLLMLLGVMVLYPYLFSVNISGAPLCNPAYMAERSVLLLIMAGYVFSGAMSFYSFGPFAAGKSGAFVVADGIAAVANIVLNIALIPVLGLTGAAAATAIAFLAGAFSLRTAASQTHRILYERGKLAGLAVSAAFIFCGMLFWDNRLSDAFLGITGAAAVFVILGIIPVSKQ